MPDAISNTPSNTLDETVRQLAIAMLERGEPLPVDLLCKLLPSDLVAPILAYPGKRGRLDILQCTQPAKLKPLRSYGEPEDSSWRNILIWGDNLPVLQTLFDMKLQDQLRNGSCSDGIRLIYVDPPFATGQTFRDSNGKAAYQDKEQGTSFIEFLRARLILVYELLSTDGTIYVHLDDRMSSQIRMVMDEIFGAQNFLNEIAWIYRGREASKSHWNRKHDTILVYVKNKGEQCFNWRQVAEDYSPATRRRFRYQDEQGFYQIRGRAVAGSPVYGADGLTPEHEKQFAGLTYRQYLKEGVPARDWWDIPVLNKAARERVGYPTQKPEALLARVILASSCPGDLVMDFFAGSGTTLAVAEKLGRHWIGVDQSKLAIDTIEQRMLNLREGIGNKGKSIQPGPFAVFSVE